MRAALYGRVSKSDKFQDPEMQMRELREYSKARGWQPFEFVDHGSGSKDRRPQLDILKQMCKRRYFEVVVVYRFDRFARSLRHLVTALEEFNALGIQFVSLHDGVDTTTPQGMLMFHICAAFAEFERNIIRERVCSGLDNARAKGKTLGRPAFVLDSTRIATLRSQGLSFEEIGKVMGVSRDSVRRAFLVALDRAKTPARVLQ